ncbi:hypothetical protein OIU85_017398 [Salix viminalis]|uniref:Uncharacterized protein n=1 Tax=Salix viminalis TaxID=40686 RepID=A0A9Q0ZQX5_SALVM|nr:hypothetical protein OIU85_017398 [Salix viminalis]
MFKHSMDMATSLPGLLLYCKNSNLSTYCIVIDPKNLQPLLSKNLKNLTSVSLFTNKTLSKITNTTKIKTRQLLLDLLRCLQRIKSISVYNYFSQEPSNPSSTKNHKNEESTPTHLTSEQIYDQIQEHDEQLQEEEEEEWFQDEENERVQGEEQTLEEIYSKLQGGKLSKTTSDTKPSSGEVPKKLPKKMRKSASAKSCFSHFEEEDIVESRRPATVREGKPSNEVGDTEVDAKADDFINKFKQQLKLQRTDSFIRYKDMINGGS